MTDGRKVCALWLTLVLVVVCASNERAANGKQFVDNPTNTSRPEPLRESYRVQTAELIKAINSTNSALEASCDFGISDIFAALIARADLAFESVGNGEEINLIEPRHARWMPIAELDHMLTNGAVRKELAVVVINFPGFGPHGAQVVTNGEFVLLLDPKWRSPEEFAFEVDEKLREAGFKQVVFASKYNGLYRRTSVGINPTWEDAQKKKPVTEFATDVPELKALEGAWIRIKAELNGRPFPEEFVKKFALKLNLRNHDYEVTFSGERIDYGIWSIDTSADPKGMTIAGIKGRNAGRAFPCIYEITGDTLRICYGFSGAERPSEFKTAAGTNYFYLETYNRKK
jgi:uncharacterized protein (TIGR03067 family)